MHAFATRSSSTEAAQAWRRRAADMSLAGALAIFLLPMLMLIAAAIVLESGRPILFRQTRLGQGGKPFAMLKFRKFRQDTGNNTLPLTRVGDRRMTRVGRILCATKLDELPQLVNVLRGDMSIVGPRPESLAFADAFEGEWRAVLDYKPGILGPSQAAFRDESVLFSHHADPSEFYRRVLVPAKARIDLAYYERRTLRGDLRWAAISVLATVGVPPSLLDRLAGPPSGAAIAARLLQARLLSSQPETRTTDIQAHGQTTASIDSY